MFSPNAVYRMNVYDRAYADEAADGTNLRDDTEFYARHLVLPRGSRRRYVLFGDRPRWRTSSTLTLLAFFGVPSFVGTLYLRHAQGIRRV
jgi:hypothetical protein